jgi:amylosucrase
MDDFAAVTTALRARGISVCIDLVPNHTAREHARARKAAKGDKVCQDDFVMFDGDIASKRYEQTLAKAFPKTAPGDFTFHPDLGKWVRTTFNDNLWNLNRTNPQVFPEIVEVMLRLAHKGVDLLRLDAVAFMWKRQGTRCQPEPEMHMLLRALRACCRIACDAVLHLNEATVSPAEMRPCLGLGGHDGPRGSLPVTTARWCSSGALMPPAIHG